MAYQFAQLLPGLTQDEDNTVMCTGKLQDLKDEISEIRNRLGDKAQQLGFASAAQRSYDAADDLTRNETLTAFRKAEEDLDLEIERNRTLEKAIETIWAEIKEAHGATDNDTADGLLPTEMTIEILTWAAPMVHAIDELPNLSEEQRRRVKEGTADQERLFQAIKEADETADKNDGTGPTAELESQVKALQSKLKTLQGEANAADRRARDERDGLSRELKNHKKAAETAAGQEEELRGELTALKLQNEQLESQKADMEKEMKRAKKTYRNVHGFLSRVVNGSRDEAPDNSSSDSGDSSEHGDPGPLTQDDVQLREEIKKHLNSTASELDAALKRAEAAERSYEEESRQCRELEDLVKKWTSKSNESSKEVIVLQGKMTENDRELRDRITILRTECDDLKRSVDSFKEKLNKANKDVRDLQAQLEGATTAKTQLKEQVATLKAGKRDVESELSKANDAIEESREEVEAAQRRLEGGQEEASKMKTLRNELRTAKEGLVDANKETASTKMELEDAQQELSTTKQSLEGVQAELSTTKQSLEGVQNELSTTKAELSTTKQSLEGARVELSTTRNSLLAAQNRAATAETDKAAAASQVDLLSAFFLGGTGEATVWNALSEPESEALEGPDVFWTVSPSWLPDDDICGTPLAMSAGDAMALLFPLLRQQKWEGNKFIALMQLLATHLSEASHAKTATCKWLLDNAITRVMQLPEMQMIPAMASVESVAEVLGGRWNVNFEHQQPQLVVDVWDVMIKRQKPFCYCIPGDEDLRLVKKDAWGFGVMASATQQTVAFIDPACVEWTTTDVLLHKGDVVLRYEMVVMDAIRHRFEW